MQPYATRSARGSCSVLWLHQNGGQGLPALPQRRHLLECMARTMQNNGRFVIVLACILYYNLFMNDAGYVNHMPRHIN